MMNSSTLLYPAASAAFSARENNPESILIFAMAHSPFTAWPG